MDELEFEQMNLATSDHYDRLLLDKDFEDKLEEAFAEIDYDFEGRLEDD